MFGIKILSASDLELGTIAPDFSLLDENGKTHTLSNFRGQKVVVHFFAKRLGNKISRSTQY